MWAVQGNTNLLDQVNNFNSLWCQIPSLNDVELHSLTSGTLVRFRCMVQDVFDPELYLALFDAKHPVTDTRVSSAHTYACHVYCMYVWNQTWRLKECMLQAY